MKYMNPRDHTKRYSMYSFSHVYASFSPVSVHPGSAAHQTHLHAHARPRPPGSYRAPRGAERPTPRASAEWLGAFTGGRSTPRTRHFCAALLEYPSRASLRPSHALSSTRRSTDDADARKPQRPTADGDAAAREPRSLARISHLPSAPPPRTRTPGEGRAQSQAK